MKHKNKKSNGKCPDWVDTKLWIKGCCPHEKDEGKLKGCKYCANYEKN